jgi:hypothetical protein
MHWDLVLDNPQGSAHPIPSNCCEGSHPKIRPHKQSARIGGGLRHHNKTPSHRPAKSSARISPSDQCCICHVVQAIEAALLGATFGVRASYWQLCFLVAMRALLVIVLFILKVTSQPRPLV